MSKITHKGRQELYVGLMAKLIFSLQIVLNLQNKQTKMRAKKKRALKKNVCLKNREGNSKCLKN